MNRYCVFSLLLLVFFSCQRQGTSNLVDTQEPIEPVEITFPNADATEMQLSPFDEGKVWVRLSSNKQEIWEIDSKSGQQKILDGSKAFYFKGVGITNNGYVQRIDKDDFDSLVWIQKNNANVTLYDQRTGVFSEVPVFYATKIVFMPEVVYFASVNGFVFWDRKTKKVAQVPGHSPVFIQQSVMLGDSTIILDTELSYNFKSKKTRKGVLNDVTGQYGAWNTIRSKGGLSVYYKGGVVWCDYQGVDKMLYMGQPIESIIFANNKLYQLWVNSIVSYDPQTNYTANYTFRLPNVNNYVLGSLVDSTHFWMYRPSQLMLFRFSDSTQLEFPIKESDKYISTITDETRVYVLYANKLLIVSKRDFLKRCVVFDAQKFEGDLTRYKRVVDSLGLMRDTLPNAVLAKLNYLKARYSSTDHVEIKNHLKELDLGAFGSVRYKFPNGYIECYKDKSMPLQQRKHCIGCLFDAYGRKSQFGKVLYYRNDYDKYFGKKTEKEDQYLLMSPDSVRSYYAVVDSLQKTVFVEDSLSFDKAMALATLCSTRWTCSEGCGGCDLTLLRNGLKQFISRYPDSQLIDNANLELIKTDFMYDGDELVITENRELDAFLKKYPDTDLRANVLFIMFENWAYSGEKYRAKAKALAKTFLKEFPKDKRCELIKKELNYI